MCITVRSSDEWIETTAEMRVSTEDGLRSIIYFDEEDSFLHNLYVAGDREYGVAAFVVYMYFRTGSIHEVNAVHKQRELTRSTLSYDEKT